MKEKERIWSCFETTDLLLWRNKSQLPDSLPDLPLLCWLSCYWGGGFRNKYVKGIKIGPFEFTAGEGS